MTSNTGKSCVVLFSGLWWCGQVAKWLAGKMKAQKISKIFSKTFESSNFISCVNHDQSQPRSYNLASRSPL